MTRPRTDPRSTLRLRRKVHFLQEGLEAGVDAKGVEDSECVEICHLTVAFLDGLLQP